MRGWRRCCAHREHRPRRRSQWTRQWRDSAARSRAACAHFDACRAPFGYASPAPVPQRASGCSRTARSPSPAARSRCRSAPSDRITGRSHSRRITSAASTPSMLPLRRMSIRSQVRAQLPRERDGLLSARRAPADFIAKAAELAGKVGGDNRLVLDDENGGFRHILLLIVDGEGLRGAFRLAATSGSLLLARSISISGRLAILGAQGVNLLLVRSCAARDRS